MGVTATKGGRTKVAHDFDNCKSALSEGQILAIVVQAVPGNPHWSRVGTDSPSPLRKCEVRRRPRVPRLARRVVTPHGMGRWWRERPSF